MHNNTSHSSSSSEQTQSKPDQRQMPNYFGKSNKSLQQNCCCFYVSAINYVETNQNIQNQKIFGKYMQRMMGILEKNDKASVDVTQTNYFNDCLVYMYLHSTKLNFEEKKELLTILEKAVQAKFIIVDTSNSQKDPTITDYSKTASFLKNQIEEIVQFLIDNFSSEDSAAFVGQSLRLLLQTDLIQQILTRDFINKLISFGENSIVSISSEALQVFHTIWKLKKPICQETVTKFLKDNWDFIINSFNSITQYPNYLANRDSLFTLYQLLSDPENQKCISKFYINNMNNLIQIMTIMAGQDEELQTQAILLLSIFIFNKNSIEQESVKIIIIKNKTKLIHCIKNIDMHYDKELDFDKDLVIHEISEFC